jgi:hypothetical protein
MLRGDIRAPGHLAQAQESTPLAVPTIALDQYGTFTMAEAEGGDEE